MRKDPEARSVAGAVGLARRAVFGATAAAAMMLLGACGQKGPLYLPPPSLPVAATASPPASASVPASAAASQATP